MVKEVVTISPDEPIEAAATLMVETDVGGMPVIDGERHVVGVITETDIFKAFVEMLGSGQSGLRLLLSVPGGTGTKGILAKLATAIADLDGNILSVGTFVEDESDAGNLVVKVEGVNETQLVDTLEALGDHVVDVREV